LNSGVIIAVRQSLGTQLVSSDLRNIRLIGTAISLLSALISVGDKLSSPGALSDLSLLNLSAILEESTSISHSLSEQLPVKQESGIGISETSSLVKIDEKKSFSTSLSPAH